MNNSLQFGVISKKTNDFINDALQVYDMDSFINETIKGLKNWRQLPSVASRRNTKLFLEIFSEDELRVIIADFVNTYKKVDFNEKYAYKGAYWPLVAAAGLLVGGGIIWGVWEYGESAMPDVQGVDTDQDGIDDVFYIDTDHDGVPDEVALDSNGNGRLDPGDARWPAGKEDDSSM